MSAKILVVDNEERMCKLIKGALELEGNYDIYIAYSGEQAFNLLQDTTFDLIVTDLKMAPVDGMALLKNIKRDFGSRTEVILMTAFASQETALDAMKAGAYDYLIKPFKMDELILRVKRILKQKALEKENARLKARQSNPNGIDGIVGKSQKMRHVFELVQRVADKDATVLIRGESGTGKELIARAVHDLSPRKNKPWVAINCAALPETLLESELFGYEKGAFTGASKVKQGLLERANGGSLFLDEIGDMPLTLQSKLLRVIQNKEVVHLGGHEPISVDVRLITATHQNLEAMIDAQTFRPDLYYRINLFPIVLPPLRERKEDIPELIESFMRAFPEMIIQPRAKFKLMQYDFPGNIRELQNLIERAAIISEGVIDDIALPMPPHRGNTAVHSLNELPETGIDLDAHIRNLLQQALGNASNKTEAAKLLGITRRRLYSMMEKFGIH